MNGKRIRSEILRRFAPQDDRLGAETGTPSRPKAWDNKGQGNALVRRVTAGFSTQRTPASADSPAGSTRLAAKRAGREAWRPPGEARKTRSRPLCGRTDGQRTQRKAGVWGTAKRHGLNRKGRKERKGGLGERQATQRRTAERTQRKQRTPASADSPAGPLCEISPQAGSTVREAWRPPGEADGQRPQRKKEIGERQTADRTEVHREAAEK